MTDADFDDLASRVLKNYKNTKTIRGVARNLGLTRSMVERCLRHLEVDFKSRPPPAPHPKKPRILDETKGDDRVVTGSGIRSLEQLLKEAKVNPDDWIVIKHVANKWDAISKNGGTIELFQIKAWLERKPGWDLKPIEVVQPIRRAPTLATSDILSALIIPDSQHGYRRQEDGTLNPLHDRTALDIAIQAARLLAPDEIVLLGDMLDLAPWSTKYTADPSLRYTTMPAMQELFYFIQQLRLAAPASKITWLEGNHEARINDCLTQKVDEALYLRRVTNPESKPVFSVPYLMNLAALDVEYVSPYGAEYWLFDKVRIHHGNVVRGRGGATVTAMLDNPINQIVGHIHRREIASRTIQTSDGPKLISAMSPGCMCRTDGIVPGRKGSTVNWHHGLGVVWSHNETVSMQLIPINEGSAIINGHPILGDPQLATIRRATGLPI